MSLIETQSTARVIGNGDQVGGLSGYPAAIKYNGITHVILRRLTFGFSDIYSVAIKELLVTTICTTIGEWSAS